MADTHTARQFVDTSYGRTAYFEMGSGPAALFVHGLPLSAFQWRNTMARLTDIRRMVAIDQMGLGFSEIDKDEDLTFAAQAANLAEVINGLGLGAVDLVGNDTGAGICQLLTATHPNLVRSLTLTNCEVHDLWPNEMLAGFYETVASGEFAGALKAATTDLTLAQTQIAPLVYEHEASVTAETLEACFAPITASENRIRQFAALADWKTNQQQLVDIAPKLRASKIPAQIVWGMADIVFDAEPSIAWLEANLGGLRSVTRIADAKLFFPEEHAHQLAEYLRTHWIAAS